MKRSNGSRFPVYMLLFFITIIVSGCASTNPMPLNKNTSQLNITNEAIAIMSLKISNQYVPSYQPNVKQIEVIQNGEKKGLNFKVEEAYFKVKDEYNEYLISFQLSPGSYRIGEVRGGSGNFPVAGHFEFPMDAEFKIGLNTITYIGHVEMVNRKKKDDEPRAGGLFPLLDQAATGFSGGTFDIKISDRYIEDKIIFKEKYLSIDEYEIKKNIAVIAKTKPEN